MRKFSVIKISPKVFIIIIDWNMTAIITSTKYILEDNPDWNNFIFVTLLTENKLTQKITGETF